MNWQDLLKRPPQRKATVHANPDTVQDSPDERPGAARPENGPDSSGFGHQTLIHTKVDAPGKVLEQPIRIQLKEQVMGGLTRAASFQRLLSQDQPPSGIGS